MNLREHLAYALATFFYVGKFPLGPGTLASAVGAFLAVKMQQAPLVLAAFIVILTIAGIRSGGVVEKALGKKDPGSVVIDEVAGIMLSFFMVPLSWPVLVTGFFLFRAFDMFKIYPANRFEEQGGGRGIMMDDLVAGLYTNIVLQCAVRLAGKMS